MPLLYQNIATHLFQKFAVTVRTNNSFSYLGYLVLLRRTELSVAITFRHTHTHTHSHNLNCLCVCVCLRGGAYGKWKAFMLAALTGQILLPPLIYPPPPVPLHIHIPNDLHVRVSGSKTGSILFACVQKNSPALRRREGASFVSVCVFRPPPVKIKKKKIKPVEPVEEPRPPRKLSDGNVFPKTAVRKLPTSRKFSDANALPQVPQTYGALFIFRKQFF
jgi:hypothetical protein